MDTTTSEEGAVVAAQPTTNEAGADDGAMVITTDEQGTPTMVPADQVTTEEPNAASTQDESTEAVETTEPTEATAETSTQADNTDSEIVEWAKKKGLEINPNNPNEVKLAKLQLENDRRFHEQQQKIKVLPPELLAETEDPTLNAIVERQNNVELKTYVRDWFDANPEMKEHRDTLMQIAAERPYLQDMDDVAAHLYRNPDFVSNIKKDAGRQALENLAQKQSARPPEASASNTAVYASDSVITPQNVYDLVETHDQDWFEKNHDKISRAMQGK
jgi:hypothetical protein